MGNVSANVRTLACLVVLAAALVQPGCKKTSEDAQTSALARTNPDLEPWPSAPPSGSQLVVTFVKMIGQGERLGATMRLFNFADAAITELELVLSYQDGKGTELGTFRTHLAAASLVQPKGQALLPMGGSTPPDTTMVAATVTYVARGESNTWGVTKSLIGTRAPNSLETQRGRHRAPRARSISRDK